MVAWHRLGQGRCLLAGDFRKLGYSIEWHDFETREDFAWYQTFHPQGLEICLNLAGRGQVEAGGQKLELDRFTGGFYAQKGACLRGVRRGGERHQFLTLEFSLSFLRHRAAGSCAGIHDGLAELLAGRQQLLAAVSSSQPLDSGQQEAVNRLRHPPVQPSAQAMWYEGKALEIAATLLYPPAAGDEFFCERIKRLNRERAEKVGRLLKEHLVEPLSLEEMGRRVGCSPFHLSRIFSQETGRTITAHLRELRLERAAELLRTGEGNVTEAAFAVGYNSLSHFTVAFRERFGCCPGLYPLHARPAQGADRSVA